MEESGPRTVPCFGMDVWLVPRPAAADAWGLRGRGAPQPDWRRERASGAAVSDMLKNDSAQTQMRRLPWKSDHGCPVIALPRTKQRELETLMQLVATAAFREMAPPALCDCGARLPSLLQVE